MRRGTIAHQDVGCRTTLAARRRLRPRIGVVMAGTALQQASDSPALLASAVPTVILDRNLRVCAVNAAYEEVSLRKRAMLVGQEVFVAFPDDPREPMGRPQLVSSLERVLSRGERHHLGFIRYDIASPDDPDVYLPRVWSAVNSPILDGGRAVGVLEQVEDVTSLALSTASGVAEGDESVTRLAVALASATATLAALQEDNSQMEAALASSRVIGVAIGKLMCQNSLSREQALDLLRLRSQHSNRRLRDIAEEFVDTGSLPSALS